MNPPSKTPETDAEWSKFIHSDHTPEDAREFFDHARKLEIERDEARAALERINAIADYTDDVWLALEEIGAISHNVLNGHERDAACEFWDEEKAKREAFENALAALMPFVLRDFVPGTTTRAHREAVENACALLGIKPETGGGDE